MRLKSTGPRKEEGGRRKEGSLLHLAVRDELAVNNASASFSGLNN
jgi:hypothetical protein